MSKAYQTPLPSLPKKAGYFPILDALRFCLAFWVAVGHFEMIPIFGDPSTGYGLWHLFKRGWNTVVFGTPAVIVFFVISGFCIHLPHRGTGKIDVFRYYLRRYTRILIPVAGALLVYRLMGRHLIYWGEDSILWHSPLWSLACEEIYYAMYPLLRLLRNTAGWAILLPSSFLASVLISVRHRHAGDWHIFGPMGTAMMLLPVWLLGCILAEGTESLGARKALGSIWIWRGGIWLGSWTAEMLHFKAHISYTQTMVWFGVLAFFWVREEMIWAKTHTPNRYLVAAGAWSYSLYLMHTVGAELFDSLNLTWLPKVIYWVLVMASSLVFSYLFYAIVERPSHKLARKIKVRGGSGRIQSNPASGAPSLVPELTPPSAGKD
ncbi:MAG TPA: acyltransferase [Candidatus Eisenbacteria bacterium]|nr:acyltransferase [Candidatus Eisenbacteria bacterium]